MIKTNNFMTTVGALPARWFGSYIVVACVSCVFAPNALAQNDFALNDEILQQIKRLPAQVSAIDTGGEWSAGSKSGHYRIVFAQVGWEHVSTRAYIQWIAVDGQKQSVVSTVPLDRNTSGMHSFGVGKWRRLSTGGTLYTIAATHTYAGTKGTLTIRLGEPGKYSSTLSGFE